MNWGRMGRRCLTLGLALIIAFIGCFAGSELETAYAAEVWQEITNRTQLENMNMSSNYRLMADIDLAGADWLPLGSSGNPFTGKFDGNSRVIRNLTITDTTRADQGLFSVVGSGAEINGLGIEGANITAANNTGILAGANAGTISRCYTKGSVSGNDYAGGLVGQNSGMIQNSYTQASVSGKDYLGGLAGSNSGTVQNSYAASSLTPSVFNNFLEFNGTPVGDYSAPNSGGYINIPHKDMYVGSAFTLEAWFQWDDVGTNEANFIVGKGYEQFEIHTGGGSGVNGIRFIPIWNNSGDSHIDVKNVIQPGWFHVAASYEYSDSLKQATARVYINGIAQDLWRGTTNLGKTATLARQSNTLGYGMVNGTLVPQQNNINIGRRTDGWFHFDGKISDVRFWNIARTEQDIKRDKDKVLIGNEPGLVGYWKLNEASGQALDSSGNNNSGTLTGDVVRTSVAAATHKGGLIGHNTGTVSASFYDSTVAGVTDEAGGVSQNTAAMKLQNTFTAAGWDFNNVWDMTPDYPFLRENTYTVTFDSNGGSTVASLTGKKFQDPITAPPAPTKAGSTFDGWYKEPALLNPWSFASDTLPAKDITLYAKWTSITYTLTYMAGPNGSISGTVSQMVNEGGSGSEVTAIPDAGYHFTGWNDGVATASRTDSNVTGNISVTANFALNQYTVTFKDYDNTTLKTETVSHGGSATAPADPSRDGYTFTGWSASFADITGNLTVTAQYMPNGGITYRVEHNRQTADASGYDLYETETLAGSTDQSVSAAPRSYTGFIENTGHADRIASGTVAADGSLVLRLYYDRNPYRIAPIGNQTMMPKTAGYAAGTQETRTITITRTGTGDIAGLEVFLSGGMDSAFIITQPVVTALDAGTPGTTFTAKAKNGLAAGTYVTTVTVRANNMEDVTFTVTQVVNAAPGPSQTPTPTPTPTPTSSSVIVIVNDKEEAAASAETRIVDDKSVTTITLDHEKIEEKLQREGEQPVVIIPVTNRSDVVVGELTGQTVKSMETKEAILEIRTESVTYTLPAAQINIDAVSEQVGKEVALKDIKVNVTIAAPSHDTARIVEDTANRNNYQVVVKPVEFAITCTSGSKTVEVSRFNGYVERTVAVPDGIDPGKITTGIVLNNDGTFSHVPTSIVVIDGRYYAKINSLTNSVYSVIWNPKAYKDVEGHWAQEAVNDLGSRLVLDDTGENRFEPDSDMTRAEFTAVLLRALGLMRTGTGKDTFTDVAKDAWYYDAVSIAYEYGIVSGYGNGKFGPMDVITREQAMAMATRAMKITGLFTDLKDSEVMSRLTAFGDSEEASAWARSSIAACVKSGIVSGRSGKLLAPGQSITRAEAAVLVRNILSKSELI